LGRAVISSEQPLATGPQPLGAFRVCAYSRPYGGGSRGGDRFRLELGPEGQLCFFMADATGHGEQAAAFWDAYAVDLEPLWRAFVDERQDLEALGRGFNEALCAHKIDAVASQLCMLLGAARPGGALTWANFGYGVHLLPVDADGVWWAEPSRLFGLKLGWIRGEAWLATERALVSNALTDVRRIVLLTDGFLEDDYRDPLATLAGLRVLGERVASLSLAEADEHLRAIPHEEDDASLVIVDRA